METLRKPFFVIAAFLAILIVMLDAGSSFFVKPNPWSLGKPGSELITRRVENKEISVDRIKDLNREAPPGMAISRMAVLDGLLLFNVLIIGSSLIWSDQTSGRIQGIISFVVSLLVLLGGIILFFKTLVEVLIMVALFLAAPFGTVAYLAIWGFFNVSGASAVCAMSLLLKFFFCVALVIAHQGFLKMKGLIGLILCSLLSNFIISILHGIVPGILVSITDGIAALIILIIALIWALLMLIWSIVSIVKSIF